MRYHRTRTFDHLTSTRAALDAQEIAAAIAEPLGVVQNALMYGACYGLLERLPDGKFRVYERLLPKERRNEQ